MTTDQPNPDPSPADAKSSRLSWLWFALLCVAICLLYLPVLGYATIPTWDDTSFVVFRPEILDWWGSSWWQRLANPTIGYPIPIPTALYALLRSTFGEDAYFGVLHGIHVAIHLLNSWLVWKLADRWLKPHHAAAIALTAAWALHPVLVESVAWLTNTKTLLAATAILAALVLQERKGRFRVYGLLALFLVAIGSRPDGAILPWALAAVLFAREGLQGFKDRKTWTAVLLTLQAASLPYMLWASSMHAGVAERKASSLSAGAELFFRIGRAVQLSATSIGFPLELHPSYFYRGDSTILDGLPGFGIIAVVVALMVMAWRKENRLVLTGAALLVVTYAPYSNLIHLPRLAADTYLYLPALGVLVMVAGLIRNQRVLVAACLAAASLGSLLTFQQVHRWENAITLWQPVITYEPEGDRSYRHVAFAYFVDQNWELAAQSIEAGLPYFTREREIPWYAIPILREARGPRPAADIGMRAALTNAKSDPLVQKHLLETLMMGKIPMPPAPEVRKAILDAAKVYRSNPEWMANPTAGPAINAYLKANGEL